jgi:hypothetical protein
MTLETGFFSEQLNSTPWFAGQRFDVPAINLLLCAPEEQSPQEYAFNPLSVLGKQAEWRNRHLWVLRPYIFAPKWSDDELGSLLRYGIPGTRGMGPKVEPTEVREMSFDRPARQYEILQFSGVVKSTATNQMGTIWYGPGFSDPVSGFETNLEKFKTRLLIFETLPEEQAVNNALNFAEYLAGHNGPSVLVVSGRQRNEINLYLTYVYSRLLENVPLPDLIRPGDTRKFEVLGYLFYGQNVEKSLRLPPPIPMMPPRMAEETPTKGPSKPPVKKPGKGNTICTGCGRKLWRS